MSRSTDAGFTNSDLIAIMKRGAEMRGEPWPPPSEPSTRAGVRPMPERATIYFVGPQTGPIKIGFATRLDFRMRDLRKANAYPLHVWAQVEGPVKLEREYHKRFAAHRLHGEWFERCPAIESEIDRINAMQAAA